MMAYQQYRVSQYRSPRRIDFDDPSTTKPPSLAKSAVLAALEEEERQKSRGTVERPSRSRQPARIMATATTSPTACIDRETVLKINRRPMQRRHRSCENVWPPKSNTSMVDGSHRMDAVHQRIPTSRQPGETETELEFAIGSRRYGSQDSVYFDECVRRQHKIEPLRTLFDRENVVLTDWGHRPGTGQRAEQNRTHGTPEPLTTKCPSYDDGGDDDDDHEMPIEPPVPPPRRYYLPMDKIRPGPGGEVDSILRHFQDTPDRTASVERPSSALPTTECRRSATPFSLSGPQKTSEHRSKSVQGQPLAGHSTTTTASVGLKQDGLDAKPPKKLKPNAHRGSSTAVRPNEVPGAIVGLSVTLQRYPTITDVSDCGNPEPSQPSPPARSGLEEEAFDLNSNMVWNLNIDVRHDRNTGPAVVTGGDWEPPTETPTPTPSQSGTAADQLSANYFDKQCSRAVTMTTNNSTTSSPSSFPLSGHSVTDFSRDQRFPLGHTTALELTPADDGHQHHQHHHKLNAEPPGTNHYHPEHRQECLSPVRPYHQTVHNYNEKLITDISSSMMAAPAPALTDASLDDVGLSLGGGHHHHHHHIMRLPQSSSASALNVSNQPNRNWINLNSNQIHHQRSQRGYCSSSSSSGSGSSSCQRELSVVREPRIIETGKRCSSADDRIPASPPHVAPPPFVDEPDRRGQQPANDSPIPPSVSECRNQDCNYDNKSVRSHYRAGASSSPASVGATAIVGQSPPSVSRRYVTPSPPLPPPPPPPPATEPERARSGSSGSSVKINEIFEFPPPPPFPCDCVCIEPESPGWSSAGWWWRRSRPDVSRPADTGRDCATSAQVTHPPGSTPVPPNVTASSSSSGPPSSSHEHDPPVPLPPPEPSPLEIHHLNASARKAGNDNHVIIGSNTIEPEGANHTPHSLHHRCTTNPTGTPGDDGEPPPPPSPVGDSSNSIPRSNPDGNVDYFKTNSTNGDEIGKASGRGMPRSPVPTDRLADAGHQHKQHSSPTLLLMTAAAAAEAAAEECFTPTVTSIDGQSVSQEQQQMPDAGRSQNNLGHHHHHTGCSPVRVISFTDGEYIFGPFDERSREFEQFEFLSSKFAPRAEGASPCSPANTDDGDGDNDGASGGGDDDQHKIASEPHHNPNADYGRWARFENVNIPGHHSPPSASPGTTTAAPGGETKRLTRGDEIEQIFQQLNQTLKENVTLPEPADDSGACYELGHHPVTGGQLVENVPVIESILDDLLTFSRQLEPGHTRPRGATANGQMEPVPGRADATLTEINDDNLINLLADDGDNDGDTSTSQDAVADAADKSRNGCDGSRETMPPQLKDTDETKKKSSINNDNNDNDDKERTAAPDNQFQRAITSSMAASAACPAPREDIFSNVAIFNWNPLDVYQPDGGLFMIDPRFALADMRAISPALVHHGAGGFAMSSLPTVLEEPADSTNHQQQQQQQLVGVNDIVPYREPPGVSISANAGNDAMKNDFATRRPVTVVEGINNSTTTTTTTIDTTGPGQQNNVNAPYPYRDDQPDFDRKVNTCHNYHHHYRPLEPVAATDNRVDKIVQMDQVLHDYPVPVSSCIGSASERQHSADAAVQEHDIRNCEDDGDSGIRHRQPEDAEGLKRVAWPPPADAVEYETHPSQQQQAVGQQFAPQQQQQQPQHQQQQQYYQQTIPQQQQQQPHPTYQPASAHQQQPGQRPVERIVPIQRATSIHSPLATPTKSPVNQPKYPAYPQQQPAPVNRGGRAIVPNQSPHYPQQQQRPSPRSPGIPVSSPRSPGATLNASPRGWAHVASPVPSYRPSPQQLSSPSPSSPSAPFYQQPPPQQYQQQQQPHRPGYQVFVPPPLVAQPVQPAFAHGGTGGAPWYGARKPEDQQHQPLAAQYPNSPQQQQQQPYTYQPQATQAFQPLTAQQPATAATAPSYQPIQPQYHQQQQQQLPPTLVTTLRKEPPMSQEPAPVYQTQPVAAIYQGGSNMRGDQKWPPEEYKRQSEVDNEERRKLAQQPAFRPRRQQKDYADFFAKNALNNTYPGYRAPPGTQHHA
ncbi:uncharacterized protein LOC125953286 isoform X2 [Anopheles darlingi]|uniref:uncharacterized protein LOC125953286 isoform X2 n=1 Tax=Anopheles darlingi TaxID=43151 RepID=UPI002100659D|nr:uncharacterized protein LOC125953286 isoform X2 [Anopheles darlingi]